MGHGGYTPWDGKRLGVEGHCLYIGGYVVIYGTDITQHGIPEYWYIDPEPNDTCYDFSTESFCFCTTFRMNQIPFDLKTTEVPDKDGLIRNKEIYEAVINAKERALQSLFDWANALPINTSDKDYHISEEEWWSSYRKKYGKWLITTLKKRKLI